VENTTTAIEEFLRTFEHTDSQREVDALVSQFAETFLVAGPEGSRAVKGSDFAVALPKRQEMFDKLGCRSAKLATVTVTKLDERYVMAATEWLMTFAHGDGESSEVSVGSTYIVDTKGELKILFYLTHQDIMAVLRERGILRG
jgi:hypothetical protein